MMIDRNLQQNEHFREDDFILIRDKDESIFDTKMDTKPTTFFKDAFKDRKSVV